ncbi:MAG: peptide chain release factor N(5)-glutamine methyltransferase [Thalassotalea sp.]
MELSIKSVLTNAEQVLKLQSDSAKLDAQVLLAFVLEQAISYLFTWPEKTLTPEQLMQFKMLLIRRVNGEPVAYLVGEKEFWSLKLAVAPATLIPRPETETLVELVLANHNSDETHCLDLGTGTGAIALALASERPAWHIQAIDFNDDAVKLAQQNCDHHQFSQQVNIYQSDWFSAIKPDCKFAVIVSNPPYIDKNDQHLNEGDVRFEPLSALVAQENGFADIKHIISNAKTFLTDNGFVYIEHGFEQGQNVQAIFTEHGYSHAATVKDLAGQDRITFAQLTVTK